MASFLKKPMRDEIKVLGYTCLRTQYLDFIPHRFPEERIQKAKQAIGSVAKKKTNNKPKSQGRRQKKSEIGGRAAQDSATAPTAPNAAAFPAATKAGMAKASKGNTPPY